MAANSEKVFIILISLILTRKVSKTHFFNSKLLTQWRRQPTTNSTANWCKHPRELAV